MTVAEVIVLAVSAYLACGLLFGLAFVTAGVGRVDASARGTSAGFRLLILPGTAALWPFLAARWLRAVRSEGNP
jgi:hypothetical protein